MPRIRKNENNDTRQEPFWKIGLYIRLSKEDANDDESRSITEQRKILEKHVEEDFFGGYSIIDHYVDDGLTGTDDVRDGFVRMISDMETGRINCIICKSLSRAFRNYADQGKYLEEIFPKYGVRFIAIAYPSVDSYLNMEAIENGIEIPINGVLNDRQAAKTSYDVRKTFSRKRKDGEFIGAFAPYGYGKDPYDKNHLVIDEDAAQVVRSIYEWFVHEGCGKNGIAKRLNEMGEPNPSEYKRRKGMKYSNPNSKVNDGLWNAGTVSGILQNKMYIGTMVQGRSRIVNYKVHEQINVPKEEWFVVPDTHEAVIDADTFEQAQALHKRDTRTAPGEKQVHLFAGFIRCPDCGKAMHRKTSRNIVYFSCRSYRDKNVCTKHTIREDKLEGIVLKALQKQIELTDMLAEEIERINKCPIKNSESARLLKSLQKKEQELEAKVKASDCLYFDWKNGDITREEYHRLKSDATADIQKLEQSIIAIKEEMQFFSDGIDSENPYLTTFLKRRNIQSLNRGILTQLVDTIWVYEGGEVMIDLKFDDQYRLILEYIENNRNNIAMPEQKAAV